MKNEMTIGGLKIVAEQDGLLLKVRVEDAKGKPVEWLCEAFNDGRGLCFTQDRDLLALDGVDRPITDQARLELDARAYERAEKDMAFRDAVGFTPEEMTDWRGMLKRRAELWKAQAV